MGTKQRPAKAIAIALLVTLAGTACGEQVHDAIQEAATEARSKLHEETIDLSHEGVEGKAELTPDGDLLIDGEPVPMNSRQRKAALDYREKLLAVADAGLLVGQEGAALGGRAAALAIGALFTGGNVDTEEVERKIEAEAEKMETAALTLCRSARALEAEQERFAEIVPEFAPYAKKIDIDADCQEVPTANP